MEIDEQYVLKAFSKCFACIEQLEKKIDSLANNEVGINGEKLLDNQDLCGISKVNKKTLERYRRTGLLPYFKLKGKVYYQLTDVVECMKHIKSRGG